MKICFSTLGCPEWTWSDILATAKDMGYDGIEIRGIGRELYIPNARPFRPGKIEKSIQQLKEKELEIPCLTSSCFLFHENRQLYLQEGKDYINLASTLGTPYIRVLGDKYPQPRDDIDKNRVLQMLIELADYAADKGVTVLVETNGAYADSAVMLELMRQVDHSNTGVLWDIHHPYMFMGEPVEETYGRLSEYIRHVHIKDSKMEDGRIRYCLLGEGELPLKEALHLLYKDGYDGFVSLEWVKRWYYELEEPGIVFSHFSNRIREIMFQER